MIYFLCFLAGMICEALLKFLPRFYQKESLERVKKKVMGRIEQTQFIDPVTFDQKYKQAETIDDILT